MLKIINPHTRDNDIQFTAENHKYTILTDPDTVYTSVTTWVHENFTPFDSDEVIDKMMTSKSWKTSQYYGKTKEEIKQEWIVNSKNCSNDGVNLHHCIELFMNLEVLKERPTHKDLLEKYNENPQIFDSINKTVEWGYFLKFIEDYPDLIPYRSEWVVYNEDIKISGTIDMVYENSDGSLSIYDWKRCKTISRNSFGKKSINDKMRYIPDSNYWHYLLQLSMYKYIIETKYEKKVKSLNLVKLHPNNRSKTYEILHLPNLFPTIHTILF